MGKSLHCPIQQEEKQKTNKYMKKYYISLIKR